MRPKVVGQGKTGNMRGTKCILILYISNITKRILLWTMR